MDFSSPFIVVLTAIGVWWFSTGLVLAVVRRSEGMAVRPASVMPAMTLVGAIGFSLMLLYRDEQTPMGSYAGFFGALLVWAWHEAAFLTGAMTGPRKGECPPGLTGVPRFRTAWEAVRDHELAILATGAVLWIALIGGDNRFGLAAFMLLWGMRISAKLVIYFGAPNAVSELMPRRIAYLKSYFNTRSITPLFPFVIAGAGAMFVFLCVGANQAEQAHSVVGHCLLATFMALAIVEHLILVLPVSDTALWRWAVPVSARKAIEPGEEDNKRDLLRRPVEAGLGKN